MLSMFILSRNKKLIDVNKRTFRYIDRAAYRGSCRMRTLPRINENSGGKQEGISDGLGCRRYLIMLTHHLRVQYFRTNSANIFTRWHDMRVAYRPASIISVLLPCTIASIVSRLHARPYRELLRDIN